MGDHGRRVTRASAGSSSNCLSREMIWPAISDRHEVAAGYEVAPSQFGSARVIFQAIAGGTMLSASPCHRVTRRSAGRSPRENP